MRSAPEFVAFAGLLPLVLGSAGLLDIRDDAFNATEISQLPTCLLECAAQVLPKFDCNAGDSCYCDTKGPLKDALAKCVASTCKSIEDALVGARLQAEVCHYPRHTDAPPTERVAYVLFGFVTFFLLARALYRWPQLNGVGYGWDDWVLFLSYPLIIGMTITAHFAAKYGSGKDMYYLSAPDLEGFALWAYIGEPFYTAVTFLTKLSLILLYLRIWPADTLDPKSRFRTICWVVAACLLASAFAFVMAAIFSCWPIKAGWSIDAEVTATCTDRTAAGYAQGALTILFDFIVLLLPVPRLLKLQIPTSDKICVLLTFLLGFIVTICSIVRLFYIHQTAIVTNVTYYFSFVGLWSLIEVYCTMICCCLPAAAGLIRRYWRGIMNRIGSAVSLTISTIKSKDTREPETELGTMRSRLSGPPITELDDPSSPFKSHRTKKFAIHSVSSTSRSPPPPQYDSRMNNSSNQTLMERYELDGTPMQPQAPEPEFWFFDFEPDGDEGRSQVSAGPPRRPIPARFSDFGGSVPPESTKYAPTPPLPQRSERRERGEVRRTSWRGSRGLWTAYDAS